MSLNLTNYEFLDCGNGRRLERVGDTIFERSAPQARNLPGIPSLWQNVQCSHRKETSWQFPEPDGGEDNAGIPDFHRGPLKMELRLSENGQIGIYPEQCENWDWLYDNLGGRGEALRIFNGFAYTGASSLVCAAALKGNSSAEICHLDSSRSAVNWARSNREKCSLPEDSIRFIVEDVSKFLEREIKRGKLYDGMILDPPAFGRARGGRTWVLKRDLPRLMELCRKALKPDPLFFLLSCHDPALSREDLANLVSSCTGVDRSEVETLELILESQKGESLPNGIAARWFRG